MDRRPDHRRRRNGHLPGRGIRRPDDPAGRPRRTPGDNGRRAKATGTPPFRPIFDQPPGGPPEGLLGESPVNRPNRPNWPKRAKTGINRRFRRISDPITFGFWGYYFWILGYYFWNFSGITSGFCGITSGIFAPQIQLKAFKARGPIFHFGPFQIRIQAVHPIL